MTQTVKCILSRLLCSILEFHLSGNSAFSVSLRTVLLLIGLILGTIVLSSSLPFPLSHIVVVFLLYLVVFLLYLVVFRVFGVTWLPFSFCCLTDLSHIEKDHQPMLGKIMRIECVRFASHPPLRSSVQC